MHRKTKPNVRIITRIFRVSTMGHVSFTRCPFDAIHHYRVICSFFRYRHNTPVIMCTGGRRVADFAHKITVLGLFTVTIGGNQFFHLFF
ncbi:hypothetical protein EON63_20700 [archaeon]|nr:MAG: hypothetical protein EON63_20700 [archaeon]